jgi:cytochrome b subunit of formate dehydrogenase
MAAAAVAAVTGVVVVRPFQRLTAVAVVVVSSVLEEVSPAYLAAMAALENLAAAAAVDNKVMGALPDTVREQVAAEKLPMAATAIYRPGREARQRAAVAVFSPV